MTRSEYRKIFDESFTSLDDLFKENDDLFVLDQLFMFFGFSEPSDYFKLPKIGRMLVAVGNFDEAFRIRGFTEFLENCGYCVPDMPGFLRELEAAELAAAFEQIIASTDSVLWGSGFWGREYDVTLLCRKNNWFELLTSKLKTEERSLIGQLRMFLQQHVNSFRHFKVE